MAERKLVAGESPDFMLKLGPRKAIGIELTELKGQDFINHTGRLVDPSELIENLKETIESKDEKLSLYRKHKLYRIWLVIHVADLKSQINFQLGNKLANIDFYSGFDRVFLLESKAGLLWELSA